MTRDWKKKTVESGRMIEEIKYPSSTSPAPSPTSKPTKLPDEKALENLRRRIRNLGRWINNSFTSEDHFVFLSYSQIAYAKLRAGKPDKVRASDYMYAVAEEEILKFIERCRYQCNILGIPFVYIFVTSKMNGKTGNYARIHHHMIVNAAALDIVKRSWRNGFVRSKHLFKRVDYTELAAYMLHQVTHRKDAKSYGRSKNLKKPIVTVKTLWDPTQELTPPEGARVLEARPYYLRYTLKPADS